MTRLRIALLNAAHDGADTRRNFRRELDTDVAEFSVTDGELPETFEYDAVVVTGSRSSVYWDEPWIRAAREYAREAAGRGLPCLGVCWGHQLLAEALGGEVDDMGEYEIGYREVERSGEDPLLDGLPDRFTVFTTHSDAVVDLPEGAREIATNEYGTHGFRKGNVFGVQFHPEYDPETARTVTEGKDELSDERKDRVVAGITDENYAKACEAKTLFDNFLQYATAVREERPATASD
ncbi:type 1 glutamine amidotransferase [Haloarchaeobius salinus]|uniref:type 1 glutamine amidotransferase n=1 Tax=Haloarchaeobius salinus TaxID=1198298 RepID=UPI00210C9811|nr:type 1 glutamine amidotransferase [Haloarchaeobius salinus]